MYNEYMKVGEHYNGHREPERQEHLLRDLEPYTPEQIALQSLIDIIYANSDSRAFLVVNKYLTERKEDE